MLTKVNKKLSPIISIYVFIFEKPFKNACLTHFLSLFTNDQPTHEKGKKPYLKNGPFFNLSHSFDLCVLVVSNDHDIGIDIEKYRDNIRFDLIKKRMFTENERDKDFFDIWCQKEAYVKCTGTGITKDFKYCLEQAGPEYSFKKIHIHNDYCAWLCIKM